ncbi:DNA-directed RNA polymerase subunit B'' [archaeon CG10_big_fil_rev_8_21_14_0_10_43_11]|nr:MAG: DNA-directed RNA polymerase subunit B'' [archaeon CG10_big_fil_rev_8_21_14_0_10_43_11]
MHNSQQLLQEYFKSVDLVSHNICSYDEFIKQTMQEVVNETKTIALDIKPEGYQTYEIEFGDVWVEKPVIREADGSTRKVLPIEARTRDLVYEAPIYLKMTPIADGVREDEVTVYFGNMPVMLKSELCYLNGKNKEELIKLGEDPYDLGGYFIVNGTERAIVIIEDLAPNKLFIQDNPHGKHEFVGKIFSERQGYRIPHEFGRNKQGMVYASFTRLRDIPFVILMKALGITKDSEIAEYISTKRELYNDIYINLYTAKEIKTQEDALNYIAKKAKITYIEEDKRKERIMNLIDNYFLPHVGNAPETRILKAHYLGKCVKKLLLVSNGDLPSDDKDHYSNKRLRLAGDMMEILFRRSFRMMISDIKYNYERLIKRGRIPSLQGVTRSKIFTSRLRSALATGNWGSRNGISQRLDRMNHFASVSNLRRVVSLLSSSRENFEARDLHPTHWGKLCTSETPEGQNVGLRKHLALSCEISTENPVELKDALPQLKKLGLKTIGEL